MKNKIKSVSFIISLLLNGAFILLFVLAARSDTSHISFFAPSDGYITAAALVSFPKDGSASFELIELALKPRDKAYLQFSFSSDKKQGNLLLNALYDISIISVAQTGCGIEITALSQGETVMQALTNEGIKNVAIITVE